jgi:hypothetical protein
MKQKPKFWIYFSALFPVKVTEKGKDRWIWFKCEGL